MRVVSKYNEKSLMRDSKDREGDMKMEAEIEVIQLEVQEYQELLATLEVRDGFSLRVSRRN